MQALSPETVKELSGISGPHCISIWFPTHTQRAEKLEGADMTDLKTHLNEAKEILIQEKGMGKKEVEAWLSPAYDLLKDKKAWHYTGKGFALFMSPQTGLRYYHLPFSVSPMTIVADHFHLLPVLPSYSGDGQFYLLSLTLNGTRLYSGNREGLQEVHIKTGEKVAAGETVPALHAHFHGHGDRIDDRKTELEQFLNDVDKKVCQALPHGGHAPLVIASVEYVHAMYCRVSNYKHVFPEFIRENPEHERPEDLHRKAWELVQSTFDESRKNEWNRFLAGLPKGNATTNPDEILEYSSTGKVGALFVDPASRSAKLNRAALEVFFHGGTVHSLPADAAAEAGAVYRF